MSNKQYLGDGVYVEFDHGAGYLRLTTEDGLRVTNTIWLDDYTYGALLAYVDQLKAPSPAVEED